MQPSFRMVSVFILQTAQNIEEITQKIFLHINSLLQKKVCMAVYKNKHINLLGYEWFRNKVIEA